MKIKMKSLGYLVIFFLLASTSVLQAQEKPFTINSGEIITKAVALHDKGKYAEAIAEYQRIPENDTNFVLAMYELAVSARADSQLAIAKSAVYKALEKLPNVYEHDLYTQMGSIFDEANQLDSGLVYFNRAIQKFPNSSYAYHAKGINLYISKKYDSALQYFQKAILMNPYAENSHYFLGLIAMEKGYPIQAMMSYGISLMISPHGSRSKKSLSALYSLANLTDNVLENLNNRKEDPFFKEDYGEIETYYKSKIALEKSYKISSDLDDNIFRQFSLICEKLPAKASSNTNLWESYYAPIFKELYNNKFFNAACLLMVSGLDNETVKKKVDSEKKDIGKFSTWVANQLDEIGYHRSTKKPVDKSIPGYFFENGRPAAKGRMIGSGDDQKLTGEWEYYGATGNVISKRNFTAGKLNGRYETFYYNGNKQYSGMVSNDKAKGESINYYENGLMRSKGTFDDDKKNGPYTKYFTNGSIYEVENFRNGVLEGNALTNFNSGGRKYEGSYSNGILDGPFKEYYENGRINTISEVRKGKGNGLKTEYYVNGAVYSKVKLEDGDREGPCTSWYENGQEESKEIFKKGKLHGKCTYYHRNGKVRTELTYDNGVQDGPSTTWDDEGRILFKDEYKRGHISKISHYNVLTGKLVKENVIEDREKNLIQIYDPVGNLVKEAVCDRDGNYNGLYKEYYLNGAVELQKNYENGKTNGKSISYFENGKVEKELNYKEGELQGMYNSFHDNGKKAKEGMYENGERNGYWYTYDNLGTLLETEYYIGDKMHGINLYYRPNGKIQKKEVWEYDEQLSTTEYDTSGKIIQHVVYPLGQTTAGVNYNGIGKKVREYNFSNNYLQGIEKGFYPNGQVEHISYYKNGIIDSIYVSYHSNGQKATEGIIMNDDKQGPWKTYDRFGQLVSTEYYHDGSSYGIDTMYSSIGTIETTIPYKNGEKHGWVSKYALSGELMYKLHYIEDLIVGYTYQGKSGDLVPEVLLEMNGKPIQIKTYFKEGGPSAEFTYINGNFEGKRIFYHTNGKIFYEINLQQGVANGTEKEYYLNGQLCTNRLYTHGEFEGVQQKFNDKGQLLTEDNYVNGYRHGISKYYDKNGQLSQTLTYYWGELLDIK